MIASFAKVLVVALAAGTALTACAPGSGNCNPKGGGSGTAPVTVKVVSDPQTIGTYDPKTVTVKAGDAVEWDWTDSGNQHSVTGDDGSFESCLNGAGHTFVVTFSQPGSYTYKCSIHSQMTGTVVVT